MPRLIDETLNDDVFCASLLDAALQQSGDSPVEGSGSGVRLPIGSVDLARTPDQRFARKFAVRLARFCLVHGRSKDQTSTSLGRPR
ncbi:hypothetical protein, partial [Paraburkholderia bengalensis]|uniref:hypothetical protein n=1 Tax=Paraburkholderia bengalensis TaxID=2747562 RepID=UPI0030157C6C